MARAWLINMSCSIPVQCKDASQLALSGAAQQLPPLDELTVLRKVGHSEESLCWPKLDIPLEYTKLNRIH